LGVDRFRRGVGGLTGLRDEVDEAGDADGEGCALCEDEDCMDEEEDGARLEEMLEADHDELTCMEDVLDADIDELADMADVLDADRLLDGVRLPEEREPFDDPELPRRGEEDELRRLDSDEPDDEDEDEDDMGFQGPRSGCKDRLPVFRLSRVCFGQHDVVHVLANYSSVPPAGRGHAWRK
jgi:hypothetical protein